MSAGLPRSRPDLVESLHDIVVQLDRQRAEVGVQLFDGERGPTPAPRRMPLTDLWPREHAMPAEQFQNEDTTSSEGARPVPRACRVGYENRYPVVGAR
jgi:hypothetical protein